MTEDLRKNFHHDLDEIRATILQMTALVTDWIPRATEVLLNNDLGAAQAMVENDDELDLLSTELEEQCHQVLLLQNPMATDLRTVLSAMVLNAEIERSGDLAVNIAKSTRRLYGTEYSPELRGYLTKMSDEAQRMFRLAGQAYAERDASLGAALDDIDDRLDDLTAETVQATFQAHNAGSIDLQGAVQMALVSRYYERIGDHAVNVGERVQYMVTGWMPEHAAAERMRERKRRTSAQNGDAQPAMDMTGGVGAADIDGESE